MSSSDAQRSPVHHATEDSNIEPTGPAQSIPPGPNAPGRAGEGAAGQDVDRGAAGRKSGPDAAADETAIRNDADESSFGGPVNLDDPDAV